MTNSMYRGRCISQTNQTKKPSRYAPHSAMTVASAVANRVASNPFQQARRSEHSFSTHFILPATLKSENPCRLTARVSCGGWEGRLAVETGQSPKPGKPLKNARPTHRQLHAVLGGDFIATFLVCKVQTYILSHKLLPQVPSADRT